MTHVEYLEKLLTEYTSFYEEAVEEEVEAFWEGACYSLEIAIKNFKKGIDK